MASSCRVGKIQKRIVLQIGSKTHNKIGITGVTAIPLCLLCTSLIPDNSNMLVSTASGYTLCSGAQLSRMIDKFRDGDKFSQKRAELTVYFTLLQTAAAACCSVHCFLVPVEFGVCGESSPCLAPKAVFMA